jgi:hypothetical protein
MTATSAKGAGKLRAAVGAEFSHGFVLQAVVLDGSIL